jgi:hypothetical protein
MAHIRVGMTEEHFVTLAEDIHIRFSIACISKTVLWTLTMAKEIVIAALAFKREGIAFVASEELLLTTAVHIGKTGIPYIAQTILGIDKVVTRIHIAIMFNDKSVTAHFTECA